MTIGYASREPLCPRFFTPPGEVNVLKWSHSIIEEPNFINEWAAIENARSLAFEIGTYLWQSEIDSYIYKDYIIAQEIGVCS